MACFLSRPYSIVLTFTLLLILIPDIACICIGRNRTLDPCRAPADCDGELDCIDPTSETRSRCKPKSKICECQTAQIVPCPSASGCARGEGCAKVSSADSPSQTSFCVSCNAIKNPPPMRTIAPFNNKQCVDSPTPLPSPTETPGPARRSLDYCSAIDPCADGLLCLDTAVASGPLECTPESIGCRCYSQNNNENCSTSDQCQHPLETCVLNTINGNTTCASCNLVNTSPFSIEAFPSNQTQCDSLPSRPPPHFAPSAGLSYDRCSLDYPCVGDYTCMFNDFAAFETRRCTEKTTFDDCFCGTLDRKADTFIQYCDSSTKCPRAEICAQESNTFNSFCISLTRFEQSQPCDFTLLQALPSRGSAVWDESCSDDLDCVEGMYCTHPTSEFGKCYNRKNCRCKSFVPTVCQSDADCLDAEACVIQPGSKQDPYCYSKTRLPVNPYLRQVSSKPSPTPTVLPTDGWTLDLCQNDSDCQQDYKRICQHSTELYGSCDGRELCVCRAQNKSDSVCKRSTDCSLGEVCVQLTDSDDKNGECNSHKLVALEYFEGVYVEVNGSKRRKIRPPSPVPTLLATVSASISTIPSSSSSPIASSSVSASVSPSASSSPSPSSSAPLLSESGSSTPSAAASSDSSEAEVDPDQASPEPICIDAEALVDMSSSQLVFKTARRASVLCDTKNSCATAGHMVTWQGHTMMMQTYCTLHASCVRRVKSVNSPRMQRGLRVRSRTDGLHFTALAARYESKVEETVLRNVVSLGW